MSAWLELDAARIQVGTDEFLRQLLSYMDPSEVFTLLNLIIRILGQGLSERNIIIIIINFIDIFRPEDPIVTETRKTDITQIQLYI